jgi:hypothetical protein
MEGDLASLLPKEHGAYAQLGFPLATGLWYGAGQPGALAFAAAAVTLFLAHEPLSVLVGLRGVRLRDALVLPARRRLWLLVGLGALSLVLAALVAPGRAWVGALVPLAPGLALVPLFLARRVKTLAGEVVAVLAFSGSLVPVALSGPATWAEAGLGAAVWAAVFVPAVVAVHAVKASHKGKPRSRWLVPATPALAALAVVAAALVADGALEPGRRALAVLPSALVVAGVGLVLPHPRHLKRIGWVLVGANVLTLVLLLAL